jgi:hypothetical protein
MEEKRDRNLPADLGRFLIGLFMFIAGGYLFLNQVRVGTHLGLWQYGFLGMRFSVSPFAITLFLFMIGIALIFFNTKSIVGWGLSVASLVLIFIIVIASLNIHFLPATLYVVLGMLILLVGGVGLMVRAVVRY